MPIFTQGFGCTGRRFQAGGFAILQQGQNWTQGSSPPPGLLRGQAAQVSAGGRLCTTRVLGPNICLASAPQCQEACGGMAEQGPALNQQPPCFLALWKGWASARNRETLLDVTGLQSDFKPSCRPQQSHMFLHARSESSPSPHFFRHVLQIREIPSRIKILRGIWKNKQTNKNYFESQ